MATHRPPRHHPNDDAGVSSRQRPCQKARLALGPAGYVGLDGTHEEAALAALADLLAPYADQRDREAA